MNEEIPELNLTSVEKECLKIFLSHYRPLSKEISPDLSADSVLLGSAYIGKILGVSRPRAYMILTQLENKNILTKQKGKGFSISPFGYQVLDELLHRMKLLEVFLYQEMEMDLESASQEASELVIHVSLKFIESLCKKLNKPMYCPHSLKIPHHQRHNPVN